MTPLKNCNCPDCKVDELVELNWKAEKIHEKLFTNRLPKDCSKYKDWEVARWKRGEALQTIRTLLKGGYRVSAGYFTTSARGFHDNWIFYKKAGK